MRPLPQVGVLKVGALDVGFRPFTSPGEAGSSLPIVRDYAWGQVYDKIVSQPFLPILMWVIRVFPLVLNV